MSMINARTAPFVAIAGGIATLLAIVNFGTASEPRSRVRHTAPTVDATRIDVDKGAKAIRFYVDGQQVALIDANGLSH